MSENKQLIIRGASGFGDAIYLYPIARHYAKTHNVKVMTNFPEVFEDLSIETIPFVRRSPVDVDCTYTRRKHENTNVWEDIKIEAGLQGQDIPFTVSPRYMIGKKPQTKKVLFRMPYDTTWCRPDDGFVPDKYFFENLALYMKNEMGYEPVIIPPEQGYSVQGWNSLFRDVDLVITQSNHTFVLAEAMDMRCCVVFSQHAEKSKNWFVRTITPEKVIINPDNTTWLRDDCPIWEAGTYLSAVMMGLT